MVLFPVLQEAGPQSSRECSHRRGGSGSGGSAESGLSSIHHHRLNCSSYMSSALCTDRHQSQSYSVEAVRNTFRLLLMHLIYL